MKRFSAVLFAVLLAGALCVPAFGHAVLSASASGETASAFVLPTDLSAESKFMTDNVGTIGFNGEATTYTPLGNGGFRMSGYALKISGDSGFKFEADSDSEYSNKSSGALSIWIYFNSMSTEQIKIKLWGLVFDSTLNKNVEHALVWTVKKENLFSETERNMSGAAFVPGWRKIELPFVAAAHTYDGVENDPVYVRELDNFAISGLGQEAMLYCAEYVSSITSEPVISADPQGYSVISLNDNYFKNIAADKLLNDKIVIPSLADVLDYAFVGEKRFVAGSDKVLPAGTKYVNDAGEISVLAADVAAKWSMAVTKPDGTTQFCDFNSNAGVFDTVGVYSMQVVLRAEIDGKTRIIVSGSSLDINILDSTSGVWFEETNRKLSVDYEYLIRFSIDTAHWRTSIDDIVVSVSNKSVVEIVGVEYDGSGNGVVRVRGKKSGSASVSIEAECTRLDGSSKSLFKNSTKIVVAAKAKSSDKTMIIVLSCVLGAGVVAAISYAIVHIVKHNKMQVK